VRVRRSRSLYRPHAVPRYSPVGSNAPVNPKSSIAVRYVPPLWTPVGPLLAVLGAPGPGLLLHAAPTMASTAASARTRRYPFFVTLSPSFRKLITCVCACRPLLLSYSPIVLPSDRGRRVIRHQAG